jgi:hypothetical protein
VRRSAIAVVLCVSFACAQDAPGIQPIFNQLFFPTGTACLPSASVPCAYLAVANSNFDQRYNAGVMTVFNVDTMIADATATATTGINFLPNFTAMEMKSQIRIPQFSGELLFVPDAAGSASGLLFEPSRGINELTAIDVADGTLHCDTGGGTPIVATDCTAPHAIPTRSLDPYSLAFSRTASVIAIGHLRAETEPPPSTTVDLKIPLVDLNLFRMRIAKGDTSIDPLPIDQVIVQQNINGVTGVVWAPPSPGRDQTPLGSFLFTQRFATAGFLPSLLEFEYLIDPNTMRPSVMLSTGVVPIGVLSSATELRGVALSGDGTRAYVSTRYPGAVGVPTTFNSAITVAKVDTDTFQLLTVFGVGEELEHPFLRERMLSTGSIQRLLYVPDIRRDSVFILDVTNDAPYLITEITGRHQIFVNNTPLAAHTFDAPASISFVENHGGKSYAFVTNFANDTLSLIDVTDEDPRNHRIVARFGTVTYPDGTGETPP